MEKTGYAFAYGALMANHERLITEMKALYRAYVRTIESARDRIIDLGGDCDSVEKMEDGDPALISARSAIDDAISATADIRAALSKVEG